MDRPLWFKAKRYGWGWYPCTWQGWAITLGYVVAAIAIGLTIDEQSSAKEVALSFALPMILLTSGLIHIAYITGEKPRWRWGGKE